MRRIKLTETHYDIPIYEILNKLVKRFPKGFTSNSATAFLKREYNLPCFGLGTSLSQNLIYSGYLSRGDNPLPGPKYIYNINLDKISITDIDKEKVNIEKIINSYDKILTPRLGKGSLKEDLLNDLRLVFKDL